MLTSTLTAAQKSDRKNYVQGTDAGIILGVNKYQSIVNLWKEKLGLIESDDLSNNAKVQAGIALESTIGDMFLKATDKQFVKPTERLIHKSLPWMAGNLDGVLKHENAILEIKATFTRNDWGSDGVNQIPKHYLTQISHYMAVFGADRCYVAALYVPDWDLNIYQFERNKALEDIIIQKEHDFWFENVKNEIPPEPRNMDDVIKLYANQTIKDPITASQLIQGDVKALKVCKGEIKKLQEQEKKYKDNIGAFMKNHQTLMSDDNQVLMTWNASKDSERFDSKEFQKANSDLYSKYVKVQPGSRRMLIKGEKE